MSDWKEKSLNLLRRFSMEKKPSRYTESSSLLLHKKANSEKKLSLLLNEIKILQKELEDIKQDDEDSFIKYKCQLYQIITNITWEHHCFPGEIRGYVSNPLNLFHMITEMRSHYDISKELWDLISGEVEPLCASP